jgi:penicillin-binding protein 1C
MTEQPPAGDDRSGRVPGEGAGPATPAGADAAPSGRRPDPARGEARRLPRLLRRLLWALLALSVAAWLLDALLPPPLPDRDDGGTVVVAADGRPLRAYAGRDGVWRSRIDAEAVSPLYLEALLGYEDRWFWRHPGVNPAALARAGWQLLRHRRVISGGSTLTMQVARILEPPVGRHGPGGKLRQMLRALQLEWRLDKREILALYLNHAPFGGPVEGVAAASWAWLGKPPDQLSHAEAALLAVLPQAPSRYRPDRHPERARAARDKVLLRMQALGRWPAAAVQAALQEPVAARRLQSPLQAALLADRLRRRQPDARRIETLVDADLQAAIEERVAAWLARLPPATSAAVLVMANADLAVRAYVGSGRFGDARHLGHVDMVRAQRSPGSTLKPLLYGLALDDGLIHSQSLLVDAPQSFDGYRPANFDSGFLGPVGAAEALRRSLNVPAVDLLDRIGPARFAARLAHAGLELRLPRAAEPNLAIILGGAATSLEDLVGVHAALGRAGLAGTPRLQPADPVSERRLLSPGAAWIVGRMLAPPPAPGSAPDALVTKTGTSWGYRDAWALGTQAGWTVGVWVGRPDGTPMPGQYGAVTALPLLQSIAAMLPRSGAAIASPRPATVEDQPVCWPSGTAPDPQRPALCQRPLRAWILDGVVPPTLADREGIAGAGAATIWLDPDGRRRAPDCAGGLALVEAQVPRWPVLAQPWLDPAQRAAARGPAWAPACGARATAGRRGLVLTGVRDGLTLKPAPGGGGEAALDVAAVGADGEVWWLLDQRLVGSSRDGAPLRLRFPGPGRFRIVALDGTGSHAAAWVRVLP